MRQIKRATTTKNIVKLLSILLIFSIMLWASSWKSPDVSFGSNKNIYSCIYDRDHENTTLTSMGQKFEVKYVENANKECVNPYFPAIHISTQGEHNAWLHIVYTDAAPSKWQRFIDVAENHKAYPFYTLEQDFYDAPHWSYTLFSKPLSYWKGHAYAVKVDHRDKTIKCIGGVEWGFRLSYFHLRPQAITPSKLDINKWEKDWEILRNELKGYQYIK